MAIHVVHHQWTETVTSETTVDHGQGIAVADVDEADLVRRDHGDDRVEIGIVERTKTRSEREKWNVNMSESAVEKDCTILRRNI